MFVVFSGNYTDSDQCVMWQMAQDYANFEFNSPFFYGQAYNLGIEAFFAVPLIWMHVPVYYTVAISTFVSSTLPWIWMYNIGREEWGPNLGLIPLLIGLCFPVAFWQQGLLARGFVQGIFIVALAFKVKSNMWAFVLMYLGTLINPNAIFMSPILFLKLDNFNYITLKNGFIALVMFGLIYQGYHLLEQTYLPFSIHPNPRKSFGWEIFKENINRIEFLWNQIIGVQENLVLGILLIFGAIWVLLKQEKSIFNPLLFTLGILILGVVSLSMEKVNDGRDNVFYSYGRYFMAIPVAIGFMAANSRASKFIFKFVTKYPLLFNMTVCLLILIKGYFFWNDTKGEKFGSDKDSPVMVFQYHSLQLEAKKLKQFCDKEKIQTVLYGYHFFRECGSIGFSYFEPSLPFSTRIFFERRTWLNDSYSKFYKYNIVPQRVLLYDLYLDSNDFKKHFPESIQTNFGARSFVIPTGNQTLKQIADKLKLVKKFENPQI